MKIYFVAFFHIAALDFCSAKRRKKCTQYGPHRADRMQHHHHDQHHSFSDFFLVTKKLCGTELKIEK